jgi:hypothetical protein
MIYAFPQLRDTGTMFMTYNVVRHDLSRNGHTVQAEISDDCDAVLYSACDVMDIIGLRKLRGETKKPIIVGGAFSFNYWSAKIYSDIVWIGEAFEFSKLTSMDEIRASSHSYTGEVKPLFASQYIDWVGVPITQTKKTNSSYWGGAGCRNKCRFCFTSWTHKHQNNSRSNIESAREITRRRHIPLTVVSNTYDYDADVRTKDMLLVDYISMPVKASVVRCGIEFATEETRRKMCKPITNNQIYTAIQKTNVDNISLRLFHITGYDPLQDWENYIDMLCGMLAQHPNNRLLHLEFNNLQYQNYVPLYRDRKSIDPEKYINHRVTRGWYDRLRQYSKHILVGAPSPFVHVACRMGIENSRSKEQAEYWFSVLRKKDKVSDGAVYKALFDSGIMDYPEMRVRISTGEIIPVTQRVAWVDTTGGVPELLP